MNILIFLLTCYGITNMLVFGSIFNSWRQFWNKNNPTFFGKLFSCPMCLSMWVGTILSVVLTYYNVPTPWSSIGLTNYYALNFLNGCLSSGSVWILHTIQEWFERGNYNSSGSNDES